MAIGWAADGRSRQNVRHPLRKIPTTGFYFNPVIPYQSSSHAFPFINARGSFKSYADIFNETFRKWLRLSVTVMLFMFNSLSRPGALVWYAATHFSKNITDLALWQMYRSRDTYSRLHINYRPSALQSSESYPSIIDWCPFPTIRDKLILLHAANPSLDTIICDIAAAYSVDVESAEFVLHCPGQGFIRVWDLICAMGGQGTVSNCASHPVQISQQGGPRGREATPTLPAPDIDTLFTPSFARLAFRKLGLDDGVPRFKLDPVLFIQYPELYDHYVQR